MEKKSTSYLKKNQKNNSRAFVVLCNNVKFFHHFCKWFPKEEFLDYDFYVIFDNRLNNIQEELELVRDSTDNDNIRKFNVINGDEILEFTITRQKIQENNVTSEIIDGIGYIRIFAFDNDIYKQFRTTYDEIANQGISGLVIDLRNNPGGYVDDTLKIIDMFVGHQHGAGRAAVMAHFIVGQYLTVIDVFRESAYDSHFHSVFVSRHALHSRYERREKTLRGTMCSFRLGVGGIVGLCGHEDD